MKKTIESELIEGTKDVFTTMLMVDVENTSDEIGRVSNLTSFLGLGGDIKGMLAVHCSEEAAKTITSALLGMDVADLDEDVQDAVGEIANMIAGSVKITFAKFDQDIQLAIPTTIIGEGYRVSGFTGAESVRVPFKISNEDFSIELKYLKNN